MTKQRAERIEFTTELEDRPRLTDLAHVEQCFDSHSFTAAEVAEYLELVARFYKRLEKSPPDRPGTTSFTEGFDAATLDQIWRETV